MLVLKSLKLLNFLSHSNTTIEFKENDRLLISGKSGSGKSSIAESILWALYGKGRSDNRSLVKNGKEKATVTVKLIDKDKDGNIVKYYNIERGATSKGRQTLSIAESVDNTKYTPSAVGGLTDAQKWLEKTLLKSSYQLFINSVAYPQENIENFVRQPANKRKDLLLEIASVDDYELLYESARNKLTIERNSLISNEANLTTKQTYVVENESIVSQVEALVAEENQLKSVIELYEKQQAEYDEKKKTVDSLTNALLLSRAEVRRVQDKINSLLEQKKAKESKIEQLNNIDREAIEAGVKLYNQAEADIITLEAIERSNYEIQSKRNALIASKPPEIDYAKDIETLEKQKESLLNSKESYCEYIDKDCPKLAEKNKVNIAYFDDQIASKKVKAEELKTKLAEYELALLSIPAKVDEGSNYTQLQAVKAIRNNNVTFVSQMAQLAHQNDTINELKNDIEKIDMDVMLLNMEADNIWVEEKKNMEAVDAANKLIEGFTPVAPLLTSAKQDLYSVTVKLSRANMAKEMVEKAKQEIVELQASMAPTKERIAQIELAKEAFSQHGIKTVVIEYLLPRLEEKINEVLGQMSEFRVSLDTQKDSASGESVIEGLFINITNSEGEQLAFENYSGGERLKISVSIAEALATLQKVGFRILDEVFSSLDNESSKSFVDVMDKLQGSFAQTICISHLQEIQDMFESRVNIKKVDGTSVIE